MKMNAAILDGILTDVRQNAWRNTPNVVTKLTTEDGKHIFIGTNYVERQFGVRGLENIISTDDEVLYYMSSAEIRDFHYEPYTQSKFQTPQEALTNVLEICGDQEVQAEYYHDYQPYIPLLPKYRKAWCSSNFEESIAKDEIDRQNETYMRALDVEAQHKKDGYVRLAWQQIMVPSTNSNKPYGIEFVKACDELDLTEDGAVRNPYLFTNKNVAEKTQDHIQWITKEDFEALKTATNSGPEQGHFDGVVLAKTNTMKRRGSVVDFSVDLKKPVNAFRESSHNDYLKRSKAVMHKQIEEKFVCATPTDTKDFGDDLGG